MALYLVTEVIGPTTKGVDDGEVLAKPLGDECGENAEVLVMLPGEAPAPSPSLVDAQRLTPLRAVDFELFNGVGGHGGITRPRQREQCIAMAWLGLERSAGSSAAIIIPDR